MIIAGQAKDLSAAVHLASDGSQVAAGTIYCVIRLESDDADDGRYWGGDSWEAAPAAWPVGTHTQAGQWTYALPAAATIGKSDSVVHYSYTDDLDEALATTVCAGGEHYALAGRPATEPTGSRAITVHTQEADATTIPQAQVSLWADAEHTNLIAQFTTDVAGNADLALDDGTIHHTTVKSGHTFTPGSFIVSADATHNIEGVKVTPSAPSAPDLCVVYGTILNASGVPVASAPVTAKATTPADSGGNQLAGNSVTTTADLSGYFELELIWGIEVRFKAKDTGLDGLYDVPNAVNQDVTTWAPK